MPVLLKIDMVGDFMSLLLFLLVLGSAYLLQRFLFFKQAPKNIPHGSMGWPWLGETLAFLKPHKTNVIGSFLEKRFSRYGRVFKSHLFGHPTIVSCDNELNMFVLQNEEKLFQCNYPNTVRTLLGDLSIIVVTGEVHKKLRGLAVGLTRTCRLKSEYLFDIHKLVGPMMESWKSKKEFNLYDEVKKFTFRLFMKQILSLEPDDPQVSVIFDDFIIFTKGFLSFPIAIPGSPYAKAVKVRSKLCSTLKSIIRDRQKDLGSQKRDYLNVILMNTSLSDEEKVSVALDLLLGSYDTTSTLMAMVVYFLGQSPRAVERLQEEHQGIKEKKEDWEPLNWEDYKQMEFTQNVVNETLRCGNIVQFVHRKALKNVHYKGYNIPAGWGFLPMSSAVHLDPSLHKNAFEFDPWRWTSEETVKHFAPFGAGLRLCPGADLAKVETAFFLHHFVLNFRWRTKGAIFPVACPYVKFENGLPIEIESREARHTNPNKD